MAGVLRATGFDAAVGVLTRAEWEILDRIIVREQCVPAEERVSLTIYPDSQGGFSILLNSRIRIRGGFMTREAIAEAGFRPDDRGDPIGVEAFECGDDDNPGWRIFNCVLERPEWIVGAG